MGPRCRVASIILCCLSTNARAEPADAEFARDVFPILQRHCLDCHGPNLQKGKLRLDSRDAFDKNRSLGKELLRRVALPKGHADIMPARGAPLSSHEVATLKRWVDAGAKWPDKLEAATHWAYVAPVRLAPPKLGGHPIDAFVLERLKRVGLQPSTEADRAVLLRRVSLDLTGLPPSPKQIDDFLNDKRPDAYERAVDAMLQSPQFGEKWARQWLDLARYADSHGFQRDDLRDLWPYRDWVIRALNDDMPFDRFTIEQLAGDLLPNATEAQKVATGFGRCSPTNVEAGSDPEETRVNQVIDRINTVGATWLGTTLECCQCHDHKYDPFSQKDYYQLFAYFNSTAIEADRTSPKVPGSIRFLGPVMTLQSTDSGGERAKLVAQIKDLDARLDVRRKVLATDMAKYEAELAATAKNVSQTHVLTIDEFHSSAASPHKLLDDHSVLLTDDPPDKDTYTIEVKTTLHNITAFQLECLTDPSLPGTGPGRGDAKRPNFILNAFRVTAQTVGKEDVKPIKFKGATASFSQKSWDVAGALDEDGKSGWAINPQFFKPHWARFETAEPIAADGNTLLTFTLVQEFGTGRTIGRLRLSAITGDAKGQTLAGDIATILKLPAAERSEKQTARLLEYRLEHDAEGAKLLAERSAADKALQPLKPPTTLVLQELLTPRETHIGIRGEFRTPGALVKPGVPAVLHSLSDGPANRLTFAKWLVDRRNPLTARVQVNRLWAEIFGRGIVATVEDFGVKGEPPTHPELLDWLAVEYMDNGWSTKKILRTIVTSATYKQSSRLTPELLAKDDRNLWLARGPRLRLDAETIRDNALAASGLLSLKQYGPPIRPYQPDGLWTKIGGDRVEYIVSPGEEKYRRGVYVVWKRGSLYPSFMNFDALTRLACIVKRSRTNTPLQALTLLNDPVYVEAALALARRALVEQPDAALAGRLQYAFQLCVARAPSEREAGVLKALYEKQLAVFQKDPARAKALLGAFDVPKGVSVAEFAAWYAVATALLNLDETITKG